MYACTPTTEFKSFQQLSSKYKGQDTCKLGLNTMGYNDKIVSKLLLEFHQNTYPLCTEYQWIVNACNTNALYSMAFPLLLALW